MCQKKHNTLIHAAFDRSPTKQQENGASAHQPNELVDTACLNHCQLSGGQATVGLGLNNNDHVFLKPWTHTDNPLNVVHFWTQAHWYWWSYAKNIKTHCYKHQLDAVSVWDNAGISVTGQHS